VDEAQFQSFCRTINSTSPTIGSKNLKPGQIIVQVDPRYFRLTEVETLLGDPSKAREKLGWEPKISFQDLVNEMVAHDLKQALRDDLCKQAGFQILNQME